jgi:hypothetical protein
MRPIDADRPTLRDFYLAAEEYAKTGASAVASALNTKPPSPETPPLELPRAGPPT